MTTDVDPRWLPVGHHWDLHIEHKVLPDAGPFTAGKPKLIWHTTESSWQAVDAMWGVLQVKDAAPHIVIGRREGLVHPVVIQCIPFDHAARALQHPSGTPETNRAGCIQVEICGYSAESKGWPESIYKALANLTVLIEHRVKVDRKVFHDFKPGVKRLTGVGFVGAASQHLGHMHVPANDHTDPESLDTQKLFAFCKSAPNEL